LWIELVQRWRVYYFVADLLGLEESIQIAVYEAGWSRLLLLVKELSLALDLLYSLALSGHDVSFITFGNLLVAEAVRRFYSVKCWELSPCFRGRKISIEVLGFYIVSDVFIKVRVESNLFIYIDLGSITFESML
jgi:hypothetical protein